MKDLDTMTVSKVGQTLTCKDSLIAATALLLGHSVATRNWRHFAPAGVQIVDPLT